MTAKLTTKSEGDSHFEVLNQIFEQFASVLVWVCSHLFAVLVRTVGLSFRLRNEKVVDLTALAWCGVHTTNHRTL